MKIEATNAPQFVKHLAIIAKLSTEENPGIYNFELFDKLVKLERRAHSVCTKQCNGDISNIAAEAKLRSVLQQVNKLLKVKTLFINGDPRGYALKLDEEEAKELGIYTDWGGYGILAPEF